MEQTPIKPIRCKKRPQGMPESYPALEYAYRHRFEDLDLIPPITEEELMCLMCGQRSWVPLVEDSEPIRECKKCHFWECVRTGEVRDRKLTVNGGDKNDHQ